MSERPSEEPALPARGAFFARLAAAILRRRLLSALLLCALAGACAVGVAQLRFDFSATAFFGSDTPELAELDAFMEAWGRDDGLLLVVGRGRPGSFFAAAGMAELVALERALDSLATVSSARSVASLPARVLPRPATVRAVLPADSARLRASPYVPSLLAADGSVTALLVELAGNMDNQGVIAAVDAVDERLAAWGERSALEWNIAGVPAVRRTIFHLMRRDQTLFVPTAAILMGLILLWTFRRLHGVAIPLATAAVPMVMLAGLMGWSGEPIGILNQIYFTLLPVIAIADSIHFVGRYREELRRFGPPGTRLPPGRQRDAIVAALASIGAACTLTSVTTVIGFLSLNLADVQILRTFGNYAALGMGLAYLCTLSFGPLLLSFSRPRVPGAEDGEHAFERGLAACARATWSHPRSVLLGAALLLGVSVVAGTKVRIDNDLVGNLAPEHPISRANALVDERLGGVLSLELDVLGPPGSFDDPALLAALGRVVEAAREDPLVRAVQGPGTLVADLGWLLGAPRELPESREELASRYRVLAASGRLGRFLSADRGRGRISVRTQDRGALAFRGLCDRVECALAQQLDGFPVEVRLTGTAFNAYRGINRLTRDLRDSLLLVALCIAVVIALLFRSPRFAALSFAPNALPLVVGYGFLGAVGWSLKPVTAVMFSVGLAIAVDDTIHLLARVREETGAGRGLREAVGEALLHCGRAVTITSLILIVGLAITLVSSFPAIVALSGLGICVIGTALAADLFLLPALLALWGPKRQPGDGSRAPDA